jgi:hypothetical protein
MPGIFDRIRSTPRRDESPPRPDAEKKVGGPQTPVPLRRKTAVQSSPSRSQGPVSPATPRRLTAGAGNARQVPASPTSRTDQQQAQLAWRARISDGFATYTRAVEALSFPKEGHPWGSDDVEKVTALAALYTSYWKMNTEEGAPALDVHDAEHTRVKNLLDQKFDQMLHQVLKREVLEQLEPEDIPSLADALGALPAKSSHVAMVRDFLDPHTAEKPQAISQRPQRLAIIERDRKHAAIEISQRDFNKSVDEFTRGVMTLERLREQDDYSPGEFTRSDFDSVRALASQFTQCQKASRSLARHLEGFDGALTKDDKEKIKANEESLASFQKSLIERLLPQVFGPFAGKGLTRDELVMLSEALGELDPETNIASRVDENRLVIELFATDLRELALRSATSNALSSALKSTVDLYSGTTVVDFEKRVLIEVRSWTPPERAGLASNLERIVVSPESKPYVNAIRSANRTAQMDFLLGNLRHAVDSFTNRQHPQPGVFSPRDFDLVIAFASQVESYEAGRGKDSSIQQIKEQVQPILQTMLAQQEFDGSLSNGTVLGDSQLESLQDALHKLGASYCVASVEQVLSMRAHANNLIDDEFIPPPPAGEA